MAEDTSDSGESERDEKLPDVQADPPACEPDPMLKLVPACACKPDPKFSEAMKGRIISTPWFRTEVDRWLVCGSCGVPYRPRGASPVTGVVPPASGRWQPGQSGNPAGRKSAGAYLSEWLNSMAEWSEDQLLKVLEDKDAPAAKRAAARVWKDAMSTRCNKVGTPIAGDELDRICDRTVGAPANSVQVGPQMQVLIVGQPPPPPPEDFAKVMENRNVTDGQRVDEGEGG
jgi:hypothetical protein